MTTPFSTRVKQMRSQLTDRYLAFKPSVETMSFAEGRDLRFFYATPQALEWYRPLSPHLRAEFAWLAERLDGRQEKMIDAGSYHGLYALVMGRSAAPESTLIIIDPVPSNCAVIEANLALNGLEARLIEAAVTPEDGPVGFTDGSCGRIDDRSKRMCEGVRLPSILPDATVVKLDIEGAEGAVLVDQIDDMGHVHTWMVELHPDLGVDPAAVIALFAQRGYALHRLDRDRAAVEPFEAGQHWAGRTTLMATRPRP